MGQDEHLESLFDILYADEGRLKSFYTQVFFGSLEQVTTQSHTEDTHRKGRCCMIQLRREWGRFSNFSFRTPQRRISAYPARPSG